MARVLSWSGKVEDDRGARFAPRVTAEDRVSLRLLTRKQIGERRRSDPARHAAITRLAVLRSMVSRRDKAVVLLSSAGAMTAFAIVVMRSGPSNKVVMPMVLVLAYAMLFAAWWTDARSLRRMRAECATLPPGCLCCAYDLAGVPTAHDGCTVCPECGAAWDFDAMDTDKDTDRETDKDRAD